MGRDILDVTIVIGSIGALAIMWFWMIQDRPTKAPSSEGCTIIYLEKRGAE